MVNMTVFCHEYPEHTIRVCYLHWSIFPSTQKLSLLSVTTLHLPCFDAHVNKHIKIGKNCTIAEYCQHCQDSHARFSQYCFTSLRFYPILDATTVLSGSSTSEKTLGTSLILCGGWEEALTYQCERFQEAGRVLKNVGRDSEMENGDRYLPPRNACMK
ncbi:hypothetical protein NEOLEDRAFT_953361 [Neolentinus lepideus HHB14362 ss-1]|uniref:Uncharacterized protein n=1 Tax=Neolentinus lepideus HHB14362 ss-1 TaxID=1314782 RepID=A0A165UET9_9AGAM|nr:hypothetical protein NEOLEDRAFT_953361 [Neolentinus lepideus HHB14362 ss-1]